MELRLEEILSNIFKIIREPAAHTTAAGALPHEPEPRDDSRNMDNTDINAVRERWFAAWNVPETHRPYWRNFNIILSLKYGPGVPAATSAEANTLWIRPEWANPGVLAHELAHESYSLLDERQKAAFKTELEALKKWDSLLILLFSRISYAASNIVEAHAEVYRYLGEHMPETLKKYYPKLLA